MSLLAKISPVARSLAKLLLRIPFREVWLSAALLLIVEEEYPFSNFPMYSNLNEESVYFVVVNSDSEVLPYVPNFRSRSSYVPKALKTERGKLEKEGMSPDAAQREAGKIVLLHLVETAEPQRREGLLRNGLKLIEVRISVDDFRLQEKENVVAEIISESR
jgi:hypothetical protein